MPVATVINTKRQILSIIKRFKFDELETAVLPSFPEISWSNIRSQLIKENFTFNGKNALHCIEKAIDEAKIPEKVLRERLSTIEVIDVSRHHKKKIWYGYKMDDLTNSENNLQLQELEQNIVETFKAQQIQMDVRVTANDSFTFISIKEKPKTGQKKQIRSSPIFLATIIGESNFFCARRNVSKLYTTVVANSLGYRKHKALKLRGSDLKSLFKLLHNKRQGAINSHSINKQPVFQEAPPIHTTYGLDFTQSHQRRSYAENCFGEDPPILETLTINHPECPIYDSSFPEEINSHSHRIGWDFRSHNIPSLLTKLAERGTLSTPLPFYLENLMTCGRNELNLL